MRKRDIIFEKLEILYTMFTLFVGYKVYDITNDLVLSVSLFVIVEVIRLYIFEQGYNLWCKGNNLEDEDED